MGIEHQVVTRDDDPDGDLIAYVHRASDESVNKVLSQSDTDPDGRSRWVWVRLQNGDLILGVFPRGDTYFAVEVDAVFPDSE